MAKIHVHTKYSLLDAIIEPKQLVEKCVKQGDKALAVTEHGNVYSNVEIYKLCKEYGIKYLYACEMYICDDVNIKDKTNKYSHLVVIAKNETGRLNLNKLVSESCKYKYYGKPRIDFKLLVKYHDGLIVCSACMAGEIQRALIEDDEDNAVNIIKKYKSLFDDDYYLEYQSHSEEFQQMLNRKVVDLANKTGVKYIVTTDAHYLNKEDQKYHNIFVQIGQAREVGETYNDCYLQSDEEILDICKSTTMEENLIALKNTNEIADKCNVDIPLSAPIMPHVNIPNEFKSELDYLKNLCIKGWYEKGIDKKQNKLEYKERLAYEIDAIGKMGFEGYFLLVYSYCNSVKRRGIARGSAGGSLVCYLTKITDIDPIEYGLYFERFIDVGALELLAEGKITKKQLKIPDVDSDFGVEDRGRVLKYVINEYGEDRVVSLGSFQYIWAKGAIKDIGRVLGIPFEVTNAMTSQLGDETIEEVIELGLLDKYKDQYPELFIYAEKLSGLPRSFSAHPCFPKDTLVMTDNGYKKIQDINVGDLVLTHTDKYRHVAKTMVNTTNSLTKISGIGFFDIESTLNHPYLVKHRTKINPREYSNPEWVNAENIVKSDMICLPLNPNNIVPKYKELPTDNKDFWWIVGRYIGDGWCEYYEHPRNEKRTIICCDKNTDDELNEIISKVKNLFEYRYVEENTTYKLFIKNDSMFEYLQRFGKYAYGKHFTKDIFDLPVDLLESFLDGYTSADGYIDKQGFTNIKTVSYELANGIIQCVGKVYHKNCSTFILPESTDIIEGREVNSKEKYIVMFQKTHNSKDRCFYDSENNCLWCYVKYNSVWYTTNDVDVYNLSVIDDNSYTVNNIAVHNCGKVIAMDEITYYNAIDINDEGLTILQGDMHTADDLGLIKADFLGLRTVDVIYDTLEMIGKDYEYIAPHNLDFNDHNVLKNFRDGNTAGIFQFESTGMQDTLKKIECNSINDLSVANALYRPGSIKYIDNYANRRKGIEEYEFLNPDLESILNNTYGIIVFQEQLIEIGRLAKLSNPDELRQATAKKKAKLLEKIKPELYDGLYKRGWSEQQLDELWESMLDFAKYSFNKCVSGSTTLIKPSAPKSVRNPSVEEMYKITHDIQFAKDNNYIPLRSKYLGAKNYGTALSMYDDGMVRTNVIRDIQEAGIHDIYKVTTSSGRYIECTLNHKFPTPNGNKKLEELSVGDKLYILGIYKNRNKRKYRFTNGDFESNIPKIGQKGFQKKPNGESVKFKTYVELCKSEKRKCEVCGNEYDGIKRFEMHHKNKDRSNNEIDNLQWCCVGCHKKLDYKLGRTKMYENGIETLEDEIVSIEYVKTEMTYDVSMDDPAHNFVANNGIITCNSHSSAYAIIAYICMFLKTYHPKEFLCAWINSVSNKTAKVAECVAEANRMGVKIYLGKYNDCSPITKVYKDGIMMGTNTIKYCNSDIATEIMSIGTVDSFIEILDKVQGLSINTRQLGALIGLNFFSDFGGNKKLQNIFNIYNGIKEGSKTILPSIRTVKQISADKLSSYEQYGLTEHLVSKYSGKSTAKLYKEIDNVGLLNEMIGRLKDESMNIIENVKFEMEYLNYITYTNPTMADYYYIVTNYKTYKDVTKPSFVARNIKTGEEIKTRIKKSSVYKSQPFGEYSILKIDNFKLEQKKKVVDGNWVAVDEWEEVLEAYEVMK